MLSPGCARYEYDLVQPTQFAQHVGGNADAVVSQNPLIYRMRSYENHLVVQVQNPTGQPVQLLGGRSFVVDPQGQSHPLRTETIAPQSFIKLILPPIPPEVAPSGPVIGFGIGVGAAYHVRPAWDDPFGETPFDRPRYLAVDDTDTSYWTWDGETDVRLSLTFAVENQPPFTQAFVFHRRRM